MKYIKSIILIFALCLFVLFIGIMTLFSYHTVYEAGYKDACKDFYKGKIRYELVTNPDGTAEWKDKN